jgi:HEAT repeat protein
VERLLQDLAKGNAEKRWQAALALRNHKTRAVVDALARAMNNSNEGNASVRRETAESLRLLGDPATVPELMKRVADDRWFEERANENAIHRNPGFPTVSDPFQGGKEAALNALKELGKPEEVRTALRRASNSHNEKVRQWAEERLRQLGPP